MADGSAGGGVAAEALGPGPQLEQRKTTGEVATDKATLGEDSACDVPALADGTDDEQLAIVR